MTKEKIPQKIDSVPVSMPVAPNNLIGAMAPNAKPMVNNMMGYNAMPKQVAEQKMEAIDFNALKTKLEDFKKKVTKKYSFVTAMVLLAPQAAPLIEEDEQLPKEVVDSRPMHLVVLVPEEQYKEIPKIKPEILKLAKETKENIWVHIKTEVDLWNYGLDSKFDMLDIVSQGFPLFDKGFLGALRVASIHKTLVLRKFDKYVASYFMCGSLVRGTATADSDVDVFVVIDDTDVKRMNRMELLEKLRAMIYDYIREATALAGVKNILNVQVSLLTDFWQRVRDVEPVAFTFIRDGIPLYDRGVFIPWKLLLKMGKIKPSAEAIDLYMKQGDQTNEFVKRRLLDSMVDIYYGIVTPTQAMFMLAGETPPIPKVIAQEAKKILVDKYGLMGEKDLKILEKAVHLFKQYEYGKLKEFPGTDVDKFLKECLEYNKMLKQLRAKLEKKMQAKNAVELHSEIVKLLTIFFGKKPESTLFKMCEDNMIKKGKLQSRFSRVIREMKIVDKKAKEGKMSFMEFDSAKKDMLEFISALVEYGQRADIIKTSKGTMQIRYGNRTAELVLLGDKNFLIEGKDIKKIEGDKIVASTKEEFEKVLQENQGKLNTQISDKVFKVLEKTLGSFEIGF
ncbi:MAG: nucleotidyltransferase domain-containing protein [Nanoarchaeota archaeon]